MVLEAAVDPAVERGVSQQVVVEEVRGCAEEVVPCSSAYFYFRVGYRVVTHTIPILRGSVPISGTGKSRPRLRASAKPSER